MIEYHYSPSYDPNYRPVVGDLVIITKSNTNWSYSDAMDKYVGTYQEISLITQKQSGRVKFKNNSENNSINQWSWVYADKHFLPIMKVVRPVLKIKSKFLNI